MDEELAHDGGDGDAVVFATCAELLVEGSQDGVAASGGEGGHVEGAADGGTSAADVALAATGSAVVVEGRQAGEGRDLAAIEPSEFGQLGQQAHGGGLAHAFDLAEGFEALAEAAVPVDELIESLLKSGDLSLQHLDELVDAGEQTGVEQLVTLGALEAEQLGELGAAAHHVGQLDEQRFGGRLRIGLQQPAVVGQQLRVDAIGLGQLAGGFAKLAGSAGVE